MIDLDDYIKCHNISEEERKNIIENTKKIYMILQRTYFCI